MSARVAFQETEVTWDADGIAFPSGQGSTRFGWSDFVRIYEGRDAIIFLQSDTLYTFVPKRARTDEQADELRTRVRQRS